MGRITGLLCATIVGVVLSPIFKLVLKIPLRIAEDAISGWINQQIGKAFGMTNPSLVDIVQTVSEWGPAFFVALLFGWLMFMAFGSRLASATPSGTNFLGGQTKILNKTDAATTASALRMTVGESGPYFSTEGSVFGIRRTFNLKLENVDRSKSLSDCSIHIMEVVPPTDNEGPWLLKDGITLAAGAHTFVPLVTYGEAREPNKSGSGDTFATIETSTGRPYLDVGPEYTVTLRATAQNTAFCDFECRIWVDENGRLRIANATTKTTDDPEATPADAVDSIKGRVTQQSEESALLTWFEPCLSG